MGSAPKDDKRCMPRQLPLIPLLLVLASSAAIAGKGDQTAWVKGTVSDADSGAPLPGVEVRVLRRGQVIASTTASSRGRYLLSVPAGRYEVVFRHGKSRLIRPIIARGGLAARVNGRLRIDPGEVIVIREKSKVRPAMAKNFNRLKTPPYSDEAIRKNVWVRSWLLLDIDRTGRLTRVKFINRPGHGLDRIALDQVMKLDFDPARDVNGRPIRTFVLWSVEWPSYWWLIDQTRFATRMPNTIRQTGAPPRAEGGPSPFDSAIFMGLRARTGFVDRMITGDPPTLADTVPCAGSGPLMHDSIHPIYRDCRMPDLSKDFDSEPWIYPPSGQ